HLSGDGPRHRQEEIASARLMNASAHFSQWRIAVGSNSAPSGMKSHEGSAQDNGQAATLICRHTRCFRLSSLRNTPIHVTQLNYRPALHLTSRGLLLFLKQKRDDVH